MIFENILPVSEEFVSLEKKSFLNREARTEKFVSKLMSGEEIDLVSGEKVIIDKVSINNSIYTHDNFISLKVSLPVLTKEDIIYFYCKERVFKITALAKTAELGGKGKGGSLGPERRILASLEEQFKNIKTPVDLNIGGKLYTNIDGVTNVKENQKADFAFTSEGTPTVFVSYKPGSGAKDIIMYGGISQYEEYGEVKRFIEAVKKRVSTMEKGSTEYAAPVEDQEVILKALFGSEFKEGSYNENSIQAIIQGDNLNLIPSDKGYILECSNVIFSPDIPSDTEYIPFYNARYANDRNQFGIRNCRFSILPGGSRGNAKVINVKFES